MQSLEQIKVRIEQAVPGACVAIVANDVVPTQASLLLDHRHAVEVARFLRDDPELCFDYASNMTGVDRPESIIKEKVRVKKMVDGAECLIEEVSERKTRAYLEAVYHLYSMKLKHGPLVIRLQTENREDKTHLPSLTPVWRSCEFQEREAFDLFGILFDGHPDLRRILMWDGFKDFPMRKDYVDPDDYEYEPTPHDEVLERAKQHYKPEVQS